MSTILIYMTCGSEVEAEKIVQALLGEKLIACANISAPQRSLYHWQGKIENATEIAVIMKSQAELFDAIRQKTVALHSYECPCVLALSAAAGHQPFLDWITSETKRS